CPLTLSSFHHSAPTEIHPLSLHDALPISFGRIPNEPTPPFPDGFDAKPAPFGVSFTGTACSEPRLIELAYAFEHATKRRMAPPSDRKSTRLNSSHLGISYAVFCLKKKNKN